MEMGWFAGHSMTCYPFSLCVLCVLCGSFFEALLESNHSASQFSSLEELAMIRPSLLVSVLVLVPALPLVGSGGDKGGKDKEDPLIAAMKFVKVPKGTFWMGWNTDNKKSKQVEIKQDFELAAYTVTQEQWQTIMGTNPSEFSRQGKSK